MESDIACCLRLLYLGEMITWRGARAAAVTFIGAVNPWLIIRKSGCGLIPVVSAQAPSTTYLSLPTIHSLPLCRRCGVRSPGMAIRSVSVRRVLR